MDPTLLSCLQAVVVGATSVAVTAVAMKRPAVEPRRFMATVPRKRVLASSQMTVTDTGEVSIDQVLPKNKDVLLDPDAYIVVQFDPNDPPPPPCAGGLADEVDWSLHFVHVHDTHLDPKAKAEQLRLNIRWRVSAARTIVWQIWGTL